MKKIFGLCIALILSIFVQPVAAQDSLISSVSFSTDTQLYSDTAVYTYTFTASEPLLNGTIIYLFFYDADGAKTTAENGPNLLYGEYASTSALNIFAYGHYIDSTAGLIYLNEDHPAGEYSFTVSEVVNPVICGTLTPALSTSIAAADSSDYAALASENLITLSIPDIPDKNKFKVKKIKARSALLKWAAQSSVDNYRLRLEVYRNYQYAKKGTYSPAANKKRLTSKILKPDTRYRFKLRACNVIGCSDWSGYKKFQTK